ncbi:bifunctional phosphoglucose/phosphomannose isomerase [Actinomycetota bacterium]
MNNLDDLKKIEELDPAGMLKAEEDFYEQLIEAQNIANNTDFSKLDSGEFKGIAILGMGGSGFSADIIKTLVTDEIKVPVEVVKGYDLPAFVGKGWLVVAVSYSGNTEETISALSQAIERDAYILIECSGGKLLKLAEDSGYTVIKIPSGLQPRGAIGYLFFPVYLAMGSIGLIDINKDDVEEALDLIKEKASIYNRNTLLADNPAKELAVKIGDRLPIIYGTEGIYSAIAYRLKCEINENGKTPSWWNSFSELNHNETVGWERLADITGNFILIAFRDPEEGPKIRTRIEVTLGQIKSNVAEIVEILVEGKSKFAKALSSMYLGDIASVYLALLAGVDPSPVVKIESLKAELAKLD